jgi:hypothetical protein
MPERSKHRNLAGRVTNPTYREFAKMRNLILASVGIKTVEFIWDLNDCINISRTVN